MAARRRRRTVSSLDAPYREVLRRIERNIKFLLSDPLGIILNPRRAKLPIPLSDIKSILILRYDALGDVVLSTPLWRTLKKHAPGIRIGVAGSTRNELLLKSDPDIDDVFVVSRAVSTSVVKELLRARKQKWDIVLNLFFHDKTRAAVFAKIMSPDGISVTIVREKKEKYERLYSFVGDRPPLPTPMVLQNLKVLLDAVEIQISEEEKLPSLKLDSDFDLAFSESLRTLIHPKKKYVLINIDASQSNKEWGLENSFLFSKQITENTDMQVLWTCGPQSQSAVEQFLNAKRPHSILLPSTPSILHLAVAVRHAAAVVTPDTSVVHFATAQQIPVVGLYLEANEFLPFGGPSRVVFTPDGKTMGRIPVAEVYNALLSFISQ